VLLLCAITVLTHQTKLRSPAAFTVSFKLETDEKLLIPKALGAIKKYGINCVVANLLHTRYDSAVVVTGPDPATQQRVLRRDGAAAAVRSTGTGTGTTGDGNNGGGANDANDAVVPGLEGVPQIEDAMIGTLVRMHSDFIASSLSSSSSSSSSSPAPLLTTP
jgi:hypothetical protein